MISPVELMILPTQHVFSIWITGAPTPGAVSPNPSRPGLRGGGGKSAAEDRRTGGTGGPEGWTTAETWVFPYMEVAQMDGL